MMFSPPRENKTHPQVQRSQPAIEYCALLQVLVSGNRRNVVLQPLLSDTKYKITVTPVYADQDSSQLSMTSSGTTREFIKIKHLIKSNLREDTAGFFSEIERKHPNIYIKF